MCNDEVNGGRQKVETQIQRLFVLSAPVWNEVR